MRERQGICGSLWQCAGVALVCVIAACGGDYSSLDEELDEELVAEVSPPARALVLDRAERRGIERLHLLVARADELQKLAGIPDRHRWALADAAARVRGASARFERLRRQGEERSAQLAAVGMAATLILADDTTGIGVADDPLLVVCGISALVILVTTAPSASRTQLDDAFNRLRVEAKALEAAIATATAVQPSQEVCAQPRPAPALPRLPDQRVSRRASPERRTTDVAPVPAQPDAPDDGRRASCAQAMPHLRRCAALPALYVFTSEHAALREMKRATGNASLSLRKRVRNIEGPCIDQGWHINVRAGGARAGSLTSCECCEDAAAGPRRLERWRIVW